MKAITHFDHWVEVWMGGCDTKVGPFREKADAVEYAQKVRQQYGKSAATHSFDHTPEQFDKFMKDHVGAGR